MKETRRSLKVAKFNFRKNRTILTRCDVDAEVAIIPKSVVTIDTGAFFGCYKLKLLIIPNNVRSIERNAISSASIEHIYISASVREISRAAFADLESLVSINVDSENPYFTSRNGILYDKEMKTLLAYPAKSFITNYEMPESVEEIQLQSFDDNYNVESIHLNKKVKLIGPYNISSCHALKQITVDEENPNFIVLDDILYSKDLKTLVAYPNNIDSPTFTIPSHVRIIDNDAFSYTKNLESVEIPNNVKTIRRNAFAYCSNLKTVKISEGVDVIKEDTFFSCHELSEVYLPMSVRIVCDSAFRLLDDEKEPFDVYYSGDREDLNSRLKILKNNDSLRSANWHFQS